MKRLAPTAAWALGILAALLTLGAYLSLWPVPVQPVAWKAPPAPGYAGVHAVNRWLGNLTLIPLGQAIAALWTNIEGNL